MTLVFPNIRDAFFDLIDGTNHLGRFVRAATHLPADEHGSLLGPFPLVHIIGRGGTAGYVDRVDRVTLEVYAEGEAAMDTAESLRSYLDRDNIETTAGFLDNIRTDQVPEEVGYPSKTLNMATVSFVATSRPL